MPKNNKKKNLIFRFLVWKYKHIPERQFIYLLSIIVGCLAGLGMVLLKNFTHLIQSFIHNNLVSENSETTLYFIFPTAGLFLVYLVIRFVIKKQIEHGIPSTLFSISKQKGIIERFKIYASILTAPITVGFGGSVGLEGPGISTGAALGSNIARLFHMNTKTRMLLIGCASAAAMSSMFKAPIAAIIFAMEVFSLDIAVASLIPLLLASLSGVITSYFFLGDDVLFNFKLQDKFQISDIGFYIALGLFTGIASVYFSKIFFGITNFFEGIKNPISRLVYGGLAIGIMLYFLPELYGEGYDMMNDLLHGREITGLGNFSFLDQISNNIWVIIVMLLVITLFKAIAMTTTFAAGGVGGIFFPTLFMGSTLGNLIAKIINNIGIGFHVSESNFTLIGMSGLMAGVLHAPLTAIFLIAEITGGYDLFIPLMIVAAISYAFTKYFVSNSIYTMKLAQRGELITHNKDQHVILMMDIDEVIETNFICVSPDMLLGEMLHKAVAKSSRNNFPVVNDEKEFLGVILLDDIRSIMFDEKLYNKVTVSSLMHSAPDVIDYDEDCMKDIMKKFKESGAWNLPVIKKGEYAGFISKSRLLSAYRQKLIEVSA